MPENPNPQLQIAVCDDEAIDRQQAETLTTEIMAEEGLDCSVSTYESAEALLTAIQGGAQFHILLLDVMMEGLDGMELAAALRKLGDSTAIIFISSNRELALRGYEVSAARYLAKPLREEQLREALVYCYKTFCEKKEILLPTSKGQRGIPLSDILYAEAMERVTKLALTDQTEEISMKFSDLSALLPERQFIPCHRSYLVNLEHIAYIRSRDLELTTGEVLPVSRYRADGLQKQFVSYLRG
jgi:DNA-binding LytR/AlgR family response regulator